MSAISNIMTCGGRREPADNCIDKKNLDFGLNWRATSSRTRISMPFQKNEFQLGTEGKSSRGNKEKRSIRMALVDERVVYGRDTAGRHCCLAGSTNSRASAWNFRQQEELGNLYTEIWHKNFQHGSFLLVDLRCHGDSASIRKRGPTLVASTAFDVLKLVAQLRITPRVLIGHSFGGKVALSMVEQAAKPLAQSVRVWSLDATPGKVRAGGDGEDHPAELISFIRKLPKEVFSKRDIVNALIQEGFSKDIAQWVVTNLKTNGLLVRHHQVSLGCLTSMEFLKCTNHNEETNLWKFVENLPQGVHRGACIGGPLKISREFMLLKIWLLRRELELKCMSLKMLVTVYTPITRRALQDPFIIIPGLQSLNESQKGFACVDIMARNYMKEFLCPETSQILYVMIGFLALALECMNLQGICFSISGKSGAMTRW
ncbi:hypothetical protein NC652_041793 [Populus alba x Populus x berolinensis]|nr:hypothetical protein NC652_041793 [Populus alba x Populus x berolinensis]